MNRIYISGGITGVPDAVDHFKKAQEELEKRGYSVINPALLNSIMPKDATYEDYMMVCLTLLSLCDSIYMLKGWEQSRGANTEYQYAVDYDYTIIYETEDMEND